MSVVVENLDSKLLETLDLYMDQFEDKSNNIISILHYAQGLFGYLPKELQLYIARKAHMSTAKINGIVTFYSFFREEKVGKYLVDVCMGTACFVKQSEEIFQEFKKVLEVDSNGLSKDGLFNLNSIRCIGACGIGPVVKINDEIFGHIQKDQVKGIVDRFRAEAANEEN